MCRFKETNGELKNNLVTYKRYLSYFTNSNYVNISAYISIIILPTINFFLYSM